MIVTRSKIRFFLPDGYGWSYHRWDDPKTKKEITRSEALKLIKANGLTKVFSSSDGDIYDREDEPFKAEHAGYFARSEAETLARLREAAAERGRKGAEKTNAERARRRELLRSALQIKLEEI